mgnify:CR=1 FL=1
MRGRRGGGGDLLVVAVARGEPHHCARDHDDRQQRRDDHPRRRAPAATIVTVATAAVAVDPDYARTRHEKAKKTRTVSLNAAPDGMAWSNAYLPATEAMAAFTAIDALAGQKDADDDRPVGARRADAFSQVFAETLDSGYTPGGCALPRRQGARPHLMVTVAASTLAYRDDLPGQLAGYGPMWYANSPRVPDPTPSCTPTRPPGA